MDEIQMTGPTSLHENPIHADAIRAAMLDAEMALLELMRNRQALRALAPVAHAPRTERVS